MKVICSGKERPPDRGCTSPARRGEYSYPKHWQRVEQMSKAKLKRTSESEDSSAGAAAATRFRLRGSWAAMWVLAFALQACTTAMASNCQCLQQDLQCPDALLSNFEKTNNIREAGNRAHWALECSDSLCSETCKAALEKIYGKNGYCAW